MLRFSDGMTFNTQGPMRVEHRSDGLYVVGGGMLIPVNSREEGEKVIERYSARRGASHPKQ